MEREDRRERQRDERKRRTEKGRESGNEEELQTDSLFRPLVLCSVDRKLYPSVLTDEQRPVDLVCVCVCVYHKHMSVLDNF